VTDHDGHSSLVRCGTKQGYKQFCGRAFRRKKMTAKRFLAVTRFGHIEKCQILSTPIIIFRTKVR
jgi:hypothetical protein